MEIIICSIYSCEDEVSMYTYIPRTNMLTYIHAYCAKRTVSALSRTLFAIVDVIVFLDSGFNRSADAAEWTIG